VIAGCFDQDTAAEWIACGRTDSVAFGRKFLANPDVPEPFRERAPLNRDDPTTCYGGGETAYVDFPTLAQQRGAEPKPCFDTRWR